jgi:diguanylate cyclase (GGDEF)-like protein
MVKGNGPRIAPDSAEVPAYVRAPIGQQVPIRAYVGIPLTYEDGRLFGTLCAIDPIQQPVSILKDQHLIELLASLLSVILRMELKRADHQREIERLELQVFTDPVSKLYNRRAWDAFLSREESRCQRYGYFASVVVVQIKHQKAANERRSLLEADQVAQRCAQALGRAARKTDVLARLGSDKFGILAVECNAEQSEQLLNRLQTELQNQDLSVSIGHKTRDPATSLTEAWHKADLILFESPQDQT